MSARPYRLQPRIQSYSWGSHTALAQLRRQEGPSAEPEAEMWMGAHPKAPSMVETDDGLRSLDALIREDPVGILGAAVAETFGPELPFLFKILAADVPLSIQAHPSRDQAREGFERENQLGIASDSGLRNYRDPNPKPELVCALTPFEVLYGFRTREASQELLRAADLADLAKLLEEPRASLAIVRLFTYLVRLEESDGKALVERTLTGAEKQAGQTTFDWVAALAAKFPDDPMCIAPLFLNLVRLEPGEALFTDAGTLHSYLTGTAIEVMANSDNVVRAGLTAKHVDSGELIKVLTFSESSVTVERGEELPSRGGGRSRVYRSRAPEFELVSMEVDGELRRPQGSVELVVCTEGEAELRTDGGALRLRSGDCALLPASAGGYALDGRAKLYAAAVPT